MSVAPFTEQELFASFHELNSFSKHLLTIYSLAIGLNAQQIVEFWNRQHDARSPPGGRADRSRPQSCDFDAARFGSLLNEQDEHWRFFTGASETFLWAGQQEPLDLVVHDAAHDYFQVRKTD